MAQSTGVGQICWYEVPVTSVSRASAFYLSVFGWKCDEEGRPSPSGTAKSVHMFTHGSLSGAFLLLPEEKATSKTASRSATESVPLATFMVENLDETIKKIEAAGGKLHLPKTEISPDMGALAHFIDTEGNLQGIWAK